MNPTRLAIRNLTKRYPGVVAVDDATLAFARGEVHGLVGENGAGKSTLIKILAGAVAPDQGELWLEGQPLRLRSVRDAYRHGLAFLHQELNLAPYLDAAENIFLGQPYPRTAWFTLDRRRLRQEAAALLAQLGVDLPVAAPVSRLAPGQQTMIAIARALAWSQRQGSASILVMDEPTAALTDQEITQLFAAIRTLRARGATVVYVSHRLPEIFAITDRVTVMRNGRVVCTAATATLDQTQLIQLMTGREAEVSPLATAILQVEKSDPIFREDLADNVMNANNLPRRLADQRPGFPAHVRREPLLTVSGLAGPGVKQVSFSLYPGEILGVAGLVGAGRSELLRLLAGAARRTAGEIHLLGQPLRLRSPADALKQGVALAPEERRSQGLLLKRPIFENVTLARLMHFARAGFLLNRRAELAASAEQQRRLGLKASNLRQPVAQLSGGNQQKVLFARTLIGEAQGAHLRLLLLDEPTRGVDVGAKEEIYQIIRTQTQRGIGVLLVSSELPELLALADRILVLHEGRQVALLETSIADQAMVLKYCYGIG